MLDSNRRKLTFNPNQIFKVDEGGVKYLVLNVGGEFTAVGYKEDSEIPHRILDFKDEYLNKINWEPKEL